MKIKRHGQRKRVKRPDLVFTDEEGYALNPLRVKNDIAALMEKVGIEFPKIYAFRKTGMMVTEANIDQWSKSDLNEYYLAYIERAASG